MLRRPKREPSRMAKPQKQTPPPKPTKGVIILAVVVGVALLVAMLYVMEKTRH